EMPPASWQRVAALAAALDDAPGSRRTELRAILTRGHLVRERAIGALAIVLRPVPVPFDAGLGEDRGRLRRFVQEVEPAGEPVLGLVTLVQARRLAGEDGSAERLLRAALRARPQEVVLHYTLGELLRGQQPPRWGDAAVCYEVARALRPELGDGLANALVNS